MYRYLPATLLILLSPSWTALLGAQEPTAWVVREVWPPFLEEGGAFHFAPPTPSGDLNRDGYPDFLTGGTFFFPFPRKDRYRTELVFGGPLIRQGTWKPKILTWTPLALLNFQGRLMEGSLNKLSLSLEILDLEKGSLDTRIPLPPSSDPTIPDPTFWDSPFFPAGDVNGDGFDDLLGFAVALDSSTDPSTHWVFTILIDGATGRVAWVGPHQQMHSGYSIYPRNGEFFDDLNGDGFRDPIVAMDFLKNGKVASPIFAISGRDGSVIWKRTPPPGERGFRNREFQTIRDVNGDAINDLITNISGAPPDSHGELRVLDGRNGKPFWTVPWAKVLPWAKNPSPNRWFVDETFGEMGDWDRDAVPDIGIMGDVLDRSGEITGHPPFHLLVFSGHDGHFLAHEPFPQNLDPFYPAISISQALDLQKSMLGDIDGDGWVEFGFRIGGYPDFGFTDTVFAIIGRPTLFAPEKVRTGEVFPLRIDVPKGANLAFQVLLSTGFDREGGFLAGGRWKTHLVKDALFEAAFGRGGFQGVLDARGQAEIPIRIPPGLHLSGKTIHAVAVVRNPAHPDGIQTVSSLARFRVR